MKITFKTVGGVIFHVEAPETSTIGELKNLVEANKPEFPSEGLKLIHAGKILKDEQTIKEADIVESTFVVVVPKPKKAVAPAPAAPAAAPAAAAPAPVATSTPAPAPPASPAPAPAATPAPAAGASTPAAPARPAGAEFETPEAVQALTDMGFPESEVRAALRAAMGNLDRATEFLINGIPAGLAMQQQQARPAAPSTPAAASPLEAFRRHPQFNELRRTVQQNPAAIQQVLSVIGQSDPALLAAIHENQRAFLDMMNEPIEEAPAAPMGGMGGAPGAGPDVAQLMQLLQLLPPQQRAQMAASMGLTPQQLDEVAHMVASLPPDQLAEMQASMGGMGGMGGGRGARRPGTIELTQEEFAAVTRLTELGFDQSTAVQAFLACDKDEQLAANMLMDGGFGGDDMEEDGEGEEEYHS